MKSTDQQFANCYIYYYSQHSEEKKYITQSRFSRDNQHIFRQINYFTEEVTKKLISRKIFWCDCVLHAFPHCAIQSIIQLDWGTHKNNLSLWNKSILNFWSTSSFDQCLSPIILFYPNAVRSFRRLPSTPLKFKGRGGRKFAFSLIIMHFLLWNNLECLEKLN